MSAILTDLVDDETATEFEAAIDALESKTFTIPETGAERKLIDDDVHYIERRGMVIAQINYPGGFEEYDDLAGKTWSPSTIVYETFDEHGFPPPTGNPYVGVKFDDDEGLAVVEVVVDG